MIEPTERPCDEHEEIQLLLPWYVTDRLGVHERERVREHLAGCERCAAAAEAEFGLRDLVAAPQASPQPSDLGLARLKQRIRQDRVSAPPPPSVDSTPRRWAGRRAALAAAVTLAIAVPVAFMAGRGGPDGAYRTLASPSATRYSGQGNEIRLVLRSPVSPEQMMSLLEPYEGVVVDGPNSAGAYIVRLRSVEPNDEALRGALESLRRQDEVLMAEVIAPVGGP
jgi:hypothetical protein